MKCLKKIASNGKHLALVLYKTSDMKFCLPYQNNLPPYGLAVLSANFARRFSVFENFLMYL